MRIRRIASLGVVVGLVAACGSSETSAPVPCSTSAAKTCLVNQQACTMEKNAPTCVACGDGLYASPTGTCEAVGGAPLVHDFADFTTAPGQEVLGLCQSWTLGNETELWVNAVELTQNEMSHHSNWTFVPDTDFAGPDGVWMCTDRNYDQLSAAVAGGVLYAQSTQAKHEVQKFPPGAAVRIPAHARIIGDVHLLNVGSTPVTGHATLTVYGIDPTTVVHKLTPFHMTYNGLAIPPHATSRFTGTCDISSDYATSTGKPYSAKLYYALPHTHKLGTRFFLQAIGGPIDGQSLIDVAGFNGEARGRAYDPPIDLSGSTGLSFGCEFENPRDTTVMWGFGDQEMCEMLGFLESDAAFESSVPTATSVGEDGQTQLFTGPCSTIFVPWDQKQ